MHIMDLLADVVQSFKEILANAEIPLPQAGEPPLPVVVGVSGGPDSLVLLHLLTRAYDHLNIEPHVAHLNHQIRGDAADDDAVFVASLAQAWDVPVTIESRDVPRLAGMRKLSMEEAAREARYALLGECAARLGTRLIAVGHNADDQAETVLMHLIRGAGLAGLRGMLPATPLSEYHLPGTGEQTNIPVDAFIIRPLLRIPRSEIEAYCAAQNLQPRFDRSNLDTTYFRNYLRHEIMPLLEEANPNIRKTLTRTASILAADHEVLQRQVDVVWTLNADRVQDNTIQFDLASWRSLPLALQRAMLRRAAKILRPSLRDLAFQHIEDALEVGLQGDVGAQATLPDGLAVHVGYDSLVMGDADYQPPPPDWPLIGPGDALEIPEPGIYSIPGGAWLFELTAYDGPRSGMDWEHLLNNPWRAPLNTGALTLPLILRTRRPGDRFMPSGAGGTQKISEFMINEKIPAAWRDNLPLLISGDQIAWVCGWRVDQRFIVQEESADAWLAGFVPTT